MNLGFFKEFMPYGLLSVIVLVIFYGIYYTKMIIQKNQLSSYLVFTLNFYYDRLQIFQKINLRLYHDYQNTFQTTRGLLVSAFFLSCLSDSGFGYYGNRNPFDQTDNL